ncbi:TPA: hypothetical protein ACF35N_004503 [Vibrio parahaemolyticus]
MCSAKTPDSTELAKEITLKINKMLGVSDSSSDKWLEFPLDLFVLNYHMQGAFYSSSNRRVYLVNETGALIQFEAKEAHEFLTKRYGEIISDELLIETVNDRVIQISESKTERNKLISKILNVIPSSVISYLKYYSQRDRISIEVDIFTAESYMHLTPDEVIVKLNHVPYTCPISANDIREDILSDYKNHFDGFDDFLKLIVASRFARDRKKCYLWLRCSSDWGKGFLFNELRRSGLVVNTSVTEVEKMMSGSPVAKDFNAFKRALVLWIDEFKSVKSEIKELCSEITISPKNQLSTTVQLYTKVFTSDEAVASLANEYGIEDQFANRFSYYEAKGVIINRDKWQEAGMSAYGDHVRSYAVHEINRMIEEMRQLGSEKAAVRADEMISEYYSKYAIHHKFKRLSESLDDVVAEISNHIYKEYKCHPKAVWFEGQVYIKSASKIVSNVITEIFDKSTAGTYLKKRDEIIKRLSVDGLGSVPTKIEGATSRVVKVRPPQDFTPVG